MPRAPMTFRLPDDLVERLDRLRERLQRERPGEDVTMTSVVRRLLVRGLDEEERHGKAKTARPR